MQSLHLIDEPAAPRSKRFALWQLGFRPFYLLASAFAALSIPLWALQFAGVLHHPYLAGPLWHAHEMLFGFALAVIVGFLFTAGRNWSNQPGNPLVRITFSSPGKTQCDRSSVRDIIVNGLNRVTLCVGQASHLVQVKVATARVLHNAIL